MLSRVRKHLTWRRFFKLTVLAHASGLLFASAQAAPPDSGLDAIRTGAGDSGFAQVLEPRAFVFPQDHGPHPEYKHEWWYVTGHLDAKTGERFGFELTFFRFALTPPTQSASPWRTRQIYMAHFAITDLDRKQFHFAERYSRDALGLAGATAEPFRVWLEDWSLAAASPSAPQTWRLTASDPHYTFNLALQPQTAPVLNGEAGLSRKSELPGSASYYFSIPRLHIQGQVIRDGVPLEVDGLAWLDREWGSGALAPDQAGWDWYALQFDDGSALMFYALRNDDGTSHPYSAGTWIEADGRTRALKHSDVSIEVLDKWSSPRGGTYPSRWRLRVPTLGLNIMVTPELADQELDTSPRYWEGAVKITGEKSGRAAGGRGYVELVGYSRPAAQTDTNK